MNKKQQHFVNEILRHGDKTKAYRTAYPDAKSDAAIESSVNRLMKNKQVKAAIDEPTNRMRAEVEAELKARMQGELLEFYECQKTLAQIVRGQYTTTKQVRVKDGFETIEVKPTINNVLTALNTFFRLNHHYPQKKTAAELKQEQKAADIAKAEADYKILRAKIPPWPTNNPHRHPFGDIYPPGYPGPYYDPQDPNTKEQFLAITEPYRLSKLAKEKAQQNTTENTTTTLLSLPSLRGTKQSNPNTGQHNAGLDCPIAEPPHNEEEEKQQQNTTKHNNQQPEPTLEEQIATKYKHVGPRVRQFLLREELRKQGWQTIDEAFYMVNDVYMRNQHSGTIQMMKLFEKAKNARNHPPNLRLPIEKETGWTFHPQYPNMMRRTRSLGW